MRRALAGLAALALLAGCATPPGPDCRRLGGRPALSVLLYFGRAPLDAPRPPAPEGEWRRFLEQEVTPRFPDGFTLIDGYGQWRNPATGRVTRQQSAVLNIVAPDTPGTLAGLDAIREAYKARFNNISVGIAMTPVCAAF